MKAKESNVLVYLQKHLSLSTLWLALTTNSTLNQLSLGRTKKSFDDKV